ncbi:MAG: phosphate signaling complex protein PhoU [Candidatus Lokiarchaeota archaeon]|nr:phosphate signaling complex protein PhoU [Candidatus Lokiarchaeota archaeon]
MTTDIFHKKLIELKKEVLKMGKLAKNMLCESIDALRDLDTELANSVMDRKVDIANYDQDIEKDTLHLITLHQPMAIDMRIIGAILKIITYLTRIGRYAKEIAYIAIKLSDQSHVKKIVHLPQMAKTVGEMIEKALKSFDEMDTKYIENISEMDDVVDEDEEGIFRECVTYMLEDQNTITRCMYYVMIARYLERCGDHACKISEKAYYMITGKHIEIK